MDYTMAQQEKNDNLIETINKISKNSSRNSKISLIIASTSLVIAIISLFISLNDKLQKKQLIELKEISNASRGQEQILHEILDTIRGPQPIYKLK